ncbi:hypothetical protein BH20CHL7_BH20CHL7_05960 [soil metagenome]
MDSALLPLLLIGVVVSGVVIVVAVLANRN